MEVQKEPQPFIKWDDKSESVFYQLKKGLMKAPALGLPVPDKFQLYVYEKGGLALGVVNKLQGITPQPVGWLSKELDQVAKGWQGCLQAVTAVSLLVPEAQKLVLNQALTVYTPPNLGGSLNSKGGLWLSNSRLLKY
jgi:hypothetical protein